MELPTSALTIPPFVICNIYLGKLLITPHKQPEASISSVPGFPEALIRPNKRRKCERFLSNQKIARLGEVLARRTRTQPLHSAII